MMQQRARSWAASSSFYIGTSDRETASPTVSPGCPQPSRCLHLHKPALLLLGLLLLCSAAVGCSFLLRSLNAWPGQALVTAGTRRLGTAKASMPTNSDHDRDRPVDDGRSYLTSNLSLLMTGGWSAETRFHPTSFRPAVAVLNNTVYCDSPADRETSLVYTDPTWLCKNVRVGDSSRLPFSDATSSPLEELLISRHEEMHGAWPPVGDSCGRLPDRRDNVLLLCELMLAEEARLNGGGRRRHGRSFRASSVHIPYGNCSMPERRRMILVGMTTSDAVWYTEKLWKPGFVTDIYCSFSA